MADRDVVVAQLRSTFGDNLKDLEERLSTSADEPALPGVTPASRAAGQAAVQDGTRGLRKVNNGNEDDLTPAERFGLEAIILLEGRPPLFIQGGDFLRVPEQWQMLTSHREQIKASIARVGRIEVTGHPELEWLGTGFLAGPETVITNRHVAREFARAQGAGWRFQPGMSARLDFNEEHGAIDPLEFEITEIVGIHKTHDLAVLRVAATGGSGSALPEPLTVAATEPGRVTDREIYVIGYPAMDGRRNDPIEMQRIFGGVYNVKRLQPGLISSWTAGQSVFHHDCSTLGGNSGSPVFDLETHHVVGLHFGGRYLVGNNAVPLWRLTGDPLLRAGGVNFA